MPSNSKRKGNSAESWCAKKLSEWWGAEFKRIPNSGALRWHGSTDTFGDLLCPVDFPGIVESKHNKAFDLLKLLTSKPSKDNILGWWLQVNNDVSRCLAQIGQRRTPVLIAKGNRSTPIIGIDAELLPELPYCPHLLVTNPYTTSFCIYTLDSFLQFVSPEIIKAATCKIWSSQDGRPTSGINEVPLG